MASTKWATYEIAIIMRLWLLSVNWLNRQTFDLFLTNFKNGLLLAENKFWSAVEIFMLR